MRKHTFEITRLMDPPALIASLLDSSQLRCRKASFDPPMPPLVNRPDYFLRR